MNITLYFTVTLAGTLCVRAESAQPGTAKTAKYSDVLSQYLYRMKTEVFNQIYEQEMGVPQGSILSPAIFSIKINDIVKAVLKGTDCSLFVEDFVSEKMLNRVERAMQLCVNSVQKWVSENGFKFISKTVCIYFDQQYVFFPQTLTFFWEKGL